MNDIHWRASKDYATFDGVSLYCFMKDERGGRWMAKPMVFEEVQAGTYVRDPTVSIDYTSAQVLMDELWNCGIRPTEGNGSAGAMKAVERHLEDMRNIVKKKGIL